MPNHIHRSRWDRTSVRPDPKPTAPAWGVGNGDAIIETQGCRCGAKRSRPAIYRTEGAHEGRGAWGVWS